MAETKTFNQMQVLAMLPQTRLQHVMEEHGKREVHASTGKSQEMLTLLISTMTTQELLALIDNEKCIFELSPQKFIDMTYPLKITSPDRERPLYVYIG